MQPKISNLPRFAVVGHPNKGKSSIVSTLAQDDSVDISPISGTTAANRIYPMSIDGQQLYQLIDTPGFQRPRQVMQWLLKHSYSVADRSQAIIQFVQQHQMDKKFHAECQLLTPIIQGAGILYVVDGSTPYGPEYDAEMEILRWTGMPSMALINPIRNESHVEQWQTALSQYFKIVRVFNAKTADNEKVLKLLSGFAQLNTDFEKPLDKAVNLLQIQYQQRIEQSSLQIAHFIHDALRYQIQQLFFALDDKNNQEKFLKNQYQSDIKKMEQTCRKNVQEIFNYQHLQTEELTLSGIDQDLFSKRSWQIFGLSTDQLIAAGAIGGAATGGVVDLALGGSTLLLGSGIGALLGGVGALLGRDQLAKINIIGGKSLGNEVIQIGPSTNVNLPFVILARALVHLQLISQRTHATRDVLQIQKKNEQGSHFDNLQRKQLASIFKKMRDSSKAQPDTIKELSNIISSIFKQRQSDSSL